jgi:secondary thiamine-phosphate synthase enzyme
MGGMIRRKAIQTSNEGSIAGLHDEPVEGGRLLIIERARLDLDTAGRGFTDVTTTLNRWLHTLTAADGMLLVFLRHTSASLTIQENADPTVRSDLLTALDRLAPEDGGWRHRSEGPDDMPAHIKTMLTTSSLTIPVVDGHLGLGTWQALYLIEHRDAAHRREITLQYMGTCKDPLVRLEQRQQMGLEKDALT